MLEIGEPPPINDYLLKMVQEYQSKEEKKKKVVLCVDSKSV